MSLIILYKKLHVKKNSAENKNQEFSISFNSSISYLTPKKIFGKDGIMEEDSNPNLNPKNSLIQKSINLDFNNSEFLDQRFKLQDDNIEKEIPIQSSPIPNAQNEESPEDNSIMELFANLGDNEIYNSFSEEKKDLKVLGRKRNKSPNSLKKSLLCEEDESY